MYLAVQTMEFKVLAVQEVMAAQRLVSASVTPDICIEEDVPILHGVPKSAHRDVETV